ncbi:MAG: hypothetical protein FD129_2215, partial [bacterium]
RRIVKGVETEGGRPHLWAATPIYHDGRVIGILEIGSALTPIIKAIQMVTRQVFVMDERTYATTLIPLKDFAGSEIGCLAILSDATAIAGILQKNNAITFAISVLGFAVVATLLSLLILRRDKS